MTSSKSALLCLVVGVGTVSLWAWRAKRRERHKKLLQRAEDELHPLLKEHTTYRSYTTSYATYPRIRTFYRPHDHRDKHAELEDVPLLVFIHGMGGVLPQFAGLLGSLTNIAPCFGIELPGHGRSSFEPRAYNAYTVEAYAALWRTAIEQVCQEYGHRQVVLIGHSMGCSLAALLCSTTSTVPTLDVVVEGLIAICPRAHQISLSEMQAARRLFALPDFAIDLLRWFDRFGGENSASVRRVVGDSNEADLKRLQLAWNRQFRTAVWKREGLGFLPRITNSDQLVGGYPGENVWKGISRPTFLIAGASDTVCKAEEIDLVVQAMTGYSIKDAPKTDQPRDEKLAATNGLDPITIKSTNSTTIQTIVFPPPAAHALLYAHATYRLVSALVESFLAHHVSPKLDFTYQLRLLTGTGKWDVKNLEKWRKVLPVSAPIHLSQENPHGLFRALKTMREQDEEHNPTEFVKKWADKIYAVIDISHDAPVYDSKILENGGIEYHKFPTVSKVPPTPLEVQDFVTLVDKLVAERDAKGDQRAIAVHCHYGYNRTGFFVASYLISRKEYAVQQAVNEFKKAKPPGIKHEHFLDVLWLQSSSGVSGRRGSILKRSPKGRDGVAKNDRLQIPMNSDDVDYVTDGDVM